MEDNKRIPMEKPGKIVRRSIYTFLRNYHYFTSISAILAFPFSISTLLSQSFTPFSLFPTIHNHLGTLFDALGFPPSSPFFTILNLKLSQTTSSFIFTFPFSLTFLLIAKSSIIQSLNHHHSNSMNKPTSPSLFSVFSIFNPLLLTYLCNSFLILSANATALSFLFVSFSFLEGFGITSPTSFLLFSSVGAVLYSFILGNAFVVCNLALVLSGMEGSGGFLAIIKACVMMRGRASTALSLAVPVNLAMAGIEALFQFRIVRAFSAGNMPSPSSSFVALEGTFIAYLYSILVVLDTVVSCSLYRSCKANSWMDQESRCVYRIRIWEEEGEGDCVSLKVSQEFL